MPPNRKKGAWLTSSCPLVALGHLSRSCAVHTSSCLLSCRGRRRYLGDAVRLITETIVAAFYDTVSILMTA